MWAAKKESAARRFAWWVQTQFKRNKNFWIIACMHPCQIFYMKYWLVNCEWAIYSKDKWFCPLIVKLTGMPVSANLQ